MTSREKTLLTGFLNVSYQHQALFLTSGFTRICLVGVFQIGFAKSQEVYNATVTGVFIVINMVEQILYSKCYLAGKNLMDADIHLFKHWYALTLLTTLI